MDTRQWRQLLYRVALLQWEHGFKLKEIADEAKVTPSQLTRALQRKQIPPGRLQTISDAVDRLMPRGPQ